MSVNLASLPLPIRGVITTGLANVLTEIVMDDLTDRTISLYPRTNAAKLTWGSGLSDGGTIHASDYTTIPADQWTVLRVGQNATAVYATSATSATVIEYVVELAS